MPTASKGWIERYLDRVMLVADLRDPVREAAVREELRDHLEQKVEALLATGLDEAESLVKATEDHGNPMIIGYRLRPWRFIDVRLTGTARGFIAVGPRARGVVAIGGLAIGVIAFGGLSIGVLDFGGLALGLLFAWGGLALGTFAYGGLAIGAVAFGGMAIGIIAAGGQAAGLWVPGAGQILSTHFTWNTVPGWWRPMGRFLSFDPMIASEVRRMDNIIIATPIITMLVLAAGLGAQTILRLRESRRLNEILTLMSGRC